MARYIFIDESGDLGDTGSEHLILAALLVNDPKPLDRAIKKMRRGKFKKELKNAHEIKANKSSKEIILHMIGKLNGIENAKAFYVVLEKKKLFSKYLKSDKHKLYNYVGGRMARNLELEGGPVHVRIDKSKGKLVLREDFNNYFLRNLKNPDISITIEHSYSHSWAGLQFADLIAWCCFQKFEHKNSGYADALKIEQEVYHVF